MLYAKYRLSDNQFLCCWPQRPDYDPATEGVQEYPEHLRPHMRLHRYDATAPDKKRFATAQELADYDAARQATAAQHLADTDPMLLAIGELIRREVNEVRADVRAQIQSGTPMPDRTRPQILDRFKTIYQAVLVQLNK